MGVEIFHHPAGDALFIWRVGFVNHQDLPSFFVPQFPECSLTGSPPQADQTMGVLERPRCATHGGPEDLPP